MAGAALAVAAGFAACEPFSSDGASAKKADAAVAVDAHTEIDAGGDGAASTFCEAHAPYLFCDDFSSGDWKAWDDAEYTNPEIASAPAGARGTIERAGDAPAPPIASFEFPGVATDADGTCGFTWTRRLMNLTGRGLSVLHYSFDMRVVRVSSSPSKEGLAVLSVFDSTNDRTIESYLMVNDPDAAHVYEQWKKSDAEYEFHLHPFGAMTLGRWMRVELHLEAKTRTATLDIDGQNRASWDFGDETFGDTFGNINFGVGYVCTAVGGAVQFDNVLLTAP